jgi:GNAT superfamily N-acetyltransferase
LFGENPPAMEKRLTAFYRAFLEAMPGYAVCMKHGGKVVALMRIIEPGRCKTSKRQLLGLLPRLLVASGPRLPRMLKWLSFLGEHDPKDRHWHLGWFAVDPELQGKGIGSLFLTYFCERVDETNDAAYVVTTMARNVSLYERYGFLTDCRASIFSVPHWFMKRTAEQINPRYKDDHGSSIVKQLPHN